MIDQLSLTYSKYQRPNLTSNAAQNRQSGSTFSIEAGDDVPKHRPSQNSHRLPSAIEGLAPTNPEPQEMYDLVDRLNQRAPYFGENVSFELDTKARDTSIIMKDQPGSVLNRFANTDLVDLERSLFDMAGFRFSFQA